MKWVFQLDCDSTRYLTISSLFRIIQHLAFEYE
jgi:hypothetical protein